jgi:NAD(P)-dependent dehydrogenase (short-subunit alcohol dehydrogenase family)
MNNAQRDAHRVCIVTGAAGGMGQEMAIALAKEGARVIVLARSEARVRDAVDAVTKASGSALVEGVPCDLSSIASIKAAAQDIVRRHPRIDLLVNNAAVFYKERRTTADGLEAGFAVNTLAPYLLTRLLEPALAGGRVVHMTMDPTAPMRFDDPQSTQKYSPLDVLKMTKSGSQYLTKEMARRYAASNISVVCVNPGLTQSKLPTEAPLPLRLVFRLFGKTPAQGARVPLAACTDSARYPTGAFVSPKGEPAAMPAFVDDDGARKLWELCANLSRA